MDKYYKPSIEEFYVGFKYESYDIKSFDSKKKNYNRDWIVKIYDGKQFESDGITTNYKLLEKDWIRVKYLDREDIESLGFKCNYTDQYFRNNIVILVDDDYFLQIISEKPDEEIYLFQGTIKNKSELKKLFKQLGIEYENTDSNS